MLAQQLTLSCACASATGRAGEELVYGGDEVSTLNQRRLVLARRIVSKLVVSAGMTDAGAIGPRTVSAPVRHGGRALKQLILPRVRWRPPALDVPQLQQPSG